MPRSNDDDIDDEFNCLYFAWLQCGEDTEPMNEDYERMMRSRYQQLPPKRCRHGKTPLTCEKCYLNGQNGL